MHTTRLSYVWLFHKLYVYSSIVCVCMCLRLEEEMQFSSVFQWRMSFVLLFHEHEHCPIYAGFPAETVPHIYLPNGI